MRREIKRLKETISNLTFISDVVESYRKKLPSDSSQDLYMAQKFLIESIEYFKQASGTLKRLKEKEIQEEREREEKDESEG